MNIFKKTNLLFIIISLLPFLTSCTFYTPSWPSKSYLPTPTYHLYNKDKLKNTMELAVLYAEAGYDWWVTMNKFVFYNDSVDVGSIRITRVDDTPAPCKATGTRCPYFPTLSSRLYGEVKGKYFTYFGVWSPPCWFGSDRDGSYRIILLPGQHVIHFWFVSQFPNPIYDKFGDLVGQGEDFSTYEYVLRFQTEAGHKYIIVAERNWLNDKSNAWIHDITANKKADNQKILYMYRPDY